MTGPLSPELRTRLEGLRRSAPATRLRVIVSLAPGVSAADFGATEVSIDQRIAHPPIVMGSATPAAVLGLARAVGVATVEVDDGGVHTLE